MVLELFKLKQDKAIPRTQNDLLIRYCPWIRVENRERRVIDGEKRNLNAGNSTYCADKLISDHVVDELITTDINSGYLTDFSDDAAGGLIAAINYGKSTDFSDISISNDAADGLITTAIDAVNLIYCDDDDAGGLIDSINAGNSMDCADIMVSDDAADGLIAIAIDAGNSTDCSKDAAGG